MIADTITELSNVTLDACTVNNVMNAIQIAILLALLRWVRGDAPDRR